MSLSLESSRIGIVVVAYNAASTLVDTLDRIPAGFRSEIAEIIILDDASADDTYALGQSWACQADTPKTLVVRHSKNLGYGGNQKAAYALAEERGLDLVVLLHADGQYAPEFLPQLVQPLLAGECEAVLGSRMMVKGAARRGGMPLYKRVGNKVLTWIENSALGTELTEFHSGFRAYKVSALAQLPLWANTNDFDFDTQIIVQLVHAGKRIVEVPIPTYYGEEICYVNGVKYAKNVVNDVLEYSLAKKGFGTAPWVESSSEYAFKEGDGSSHAMILDMMSGQSPSRVLDLGCSNGHLAERMRSAGHYVTGVDMYELEGVHDRVDRFICADLANGIPDDVGDGYDFIIAADVIEHLPRPTQTLQRAAQLLRPGGQLLLSVPNFAHWYPRTRVALGLFGYDRRGILDETHLRFFTRRTLRRTVERSGLDILEERSTGLPLGAVSNVDGRSHRAIRRIDQSLIDLRPQLFGYQFVMRLTPHAASKVMVEGVVTESVA